MHSASTQQVGWFRGRMVCRSTKPERNGQGPAAADAQQAGKPLRHRGGRKGSMGTSDSKAAGAAAVALCAGGGQFSASMADVG